MPAAIEAHRPMPVSSVAHGRHVEALSAIGISGLWVVCRWPSPGVTAPELRRITTIWGSSRLPDRGPVEICLEAYLFW
jgi:hypothetical protein